LLGGRLRDAVNVCVKHLHDMQLAYVLARLGEGERGPVQTHLLRKVRSRPPCRRTKQKMYQLKARASHR